MPCRNGLKTADVVFHAFNRAVRGTVLFDSAKDYFAFERIVSEAARRFGLRIICYCLMPNHWHFILWPHEDFQLSKFMHWMELTHAMRWTVSHNVAGTGAVYQGRFKAIPVQTNDYLITACRYVERNALTSFLVPKAEEWQWSSLYSRCNSRYVIPLHEWPILRPEDWIKLVNQPQTQSEVLALKKALQKGTPFGSKEWQERIADDLGLQKTLRPQGRPKSG